MGKVACIGAGYWGANLIRNFHDLGALAWVCEADRVRCEEFAERYPGVKVSTDLADILSDRDVQGVAIATPAATHGQVVRRALLADKDVFVEKPLCLSVAEGQELVSLARSRGRVLMVGHLLWYHPAVRKLKDLVDGGELGRIQYLYSHRLNLGRFRREENVLWSFAPHDISVILGLSGEMPDGVAAQGGNYLHGQIPDATVSLLSFPSGIRAHLFVSWLHPFKEQKLVVVGDRQMAVLNDTEPPERKLLLYPHTIDWRGGMPAPNKADAVAVALDWEEPLRAECQHFLACTATRATPRTDGAEGLRVLTVLDRCQQALDGRGGAPTERPAPVWGAAPVAAAPAWRDAPGEAAPPAPARLARGEAAPPPARPFFVHESSYIDDDVSIGRGTAIWHFSHILKGSRIGQDCRIGQNAVVGPRARIGNGVKIQNNVSVYEGVTLEDEVFCGPSMVFTNVVNPRSAIPRMNELKETRVRRGATLGANCTIVCGVTIGEYAFVGAGAVVTRDVPDYALVLGNPGRIAGWICRCGNRIRLTDDLGSCADCGAQYHMRGGLVIST